MTRHFRLLIALLLAGLVTVPPDAAGWGANAVRLITNKAVDTLPEEMRPFFEANRNFLVQHSADPLYALAKNPSERANHFIHLDHYGPFPFAALPRDYKAAVSKYTKHSLEAGGLLPWEIGLCSARLTDAFRAHNWEAARVAAASLSYYVAQAHDPFHTTINEDGKFSGQPGVDQRFDTSLVDRYSLFFFVHPNEAAFIQDPTDRAFEICLSSHSWLENILLADHRSRQKLADYTDEYYDRFYSQAGAVLVRQITDGATDVGSYWLTAWTNAGRPALPDR
jgi:hypothetical protein